MVFFWHKKKISQDQKNSSEDLSINSKQKNISLEEAKLPLLSEITVSKEPALSTQLEHIQSYKLSSELETKEIKKKIFSLS